MTTIFAKSKYKQSVENQQQNLAEKSSAPQPTEQPITLDFKIYIDLGNNRFLRKQSKVTGVVPICNFFDNMEQSLDSFLVLLLRNR